MNFYPVEEARNSNMRHRPIGMGVQGLADAFAKMRLPFDSPGAMQLNKVVKLTLTQPYTNIMLTLTYRVNLRIILLLLLLLLT